MIDTVVVVTTLVLPVLTLFLRQLMRYLIERVRWRSTERLVESCGPAVLLMLPDVARELRQHETSGSTSSHLVTPRHRPRL